ncbi:MAG: rod shape-determining protein MreD [Chlorobi bacterium]|nr:rod shape-determining protein MreD [Chlorobiota bacterium]
MINLILRNIARFVVLILIQVIILDNIQLSHYAIPFMYVLFLLLLPFETPGWLVLILGFILGFTVDLFEHTYGIHTAATVFLAFLRPLILKVVAPRDGYGSNTYPRIYYFGLTWFLKYTFILVFFHHLFLFYFEAFSFHHFFSTFLRVLLSTLFSVTLIVLSQYFMYRK